MNFISKGQCEIEIEMKISQWNLKRQVWVRLGTNFSLSINMLSGYNTAAETVVRSYLYSVTNEIWVIGESNFQTTAQTFASEIVTMIVTSLIRTFLSNSKHLP